MSYIPIPGPEGNKWVLAESLTAEQRSLVAKHRAALNAYFASDSETRSKTVERLREFKGKKVLDIPLVTDPALADQLNEEDRIDIEQFYEDGPEP